MTENMRKTILRAIERAPDWARRHLDSSDAMERIRARELLAQMIADSVEESYNSSQNRD